MFSLLGLFAGKCCHLLVLWVPSSKPTGLSSQFSYTHRSQFCRSGQTEVWGKPVSLSGCDILSNVATDIWSNMGIWGNSHSFSLLYVILWIWRRQKFVKILKISWRSVHLTVLIHAFSFSFVYGPCGLTVVYVSIFPSFRRSYLACSHCWKGSKVREHDCPSGPQGACRVEQGGICGWRQGEVTMVDVSAYGGDSVTCHLCCSSTAPVLRSDWGRPRRNQGTRTGRSHILTHWEGRGRRNPLWHRWWSRTRWPGRVGPRTENKSPRSSPTETWSTSHGQSGYTSSPSQTPEMPGLRWCRRAPWAPWLPNVEENRRAFLMVGRTLLPKTTPSRTQSWLFGFVLLGFCKSLLKIVYNDMEQRTALNHHIWQVHTRECLASLTNGWND